MCCQVRSLQGQAPVGRTQACVNSNLTPCVLVALSVLLGVGAGLSYFYGQGLTFRSILAGTSGLCVIALAVILCMRKRSGIDAPSQGDAPVQHLATGQDNEAPQGLEEPGYCTAVGRGKVDFSLLDTLASGAHLTREMCVELWKLAPSFSKDFNYLNDLDDEKLRQVSDLFKAVDEIIEGYSPALSQQSEEIIEKAKQAGLFTDKTFEIPYRIFFDYNKLLDIARPMKQGSNLSHLLEGYLIYRYSSENNIYGIAAGYHRIEDDKDVGLGIFVRMPFQAAETLHAQKKLPSSLGLYAMDHERKVYYYLGMYSSPSISGIGGGFSMNLQNLADYLDQ